MKKILILLLLLVALQLFSEDENEAERSYLFLKSDTQHQVEKSQYEKIFMENPNTFYGQSALLDLARIELLERNYDQAISYFKKIYHPEITDKEYWLAKCYLLKGDPDSAIISAQNFIYTSNDKDKVEISYFTIAEAYIEKGLFVKALNTLEYLRNSDTIENNIPLLHYKIGYCNEKLGNYEKALNSYKKLKLDFPYHEYTYMAEDRIYDLKSNDQIDIELKDVLINETDEPDTEETPTPATTPSDQPGRYLQVGAFSKEANARKLAEEIRSKYDQNYIVFPKTSNNNKLFVAAFGPFDDSNSLKKAKEKLAGFGYNSFEIKK